MYRNSIIALVILISILERRSFASPIIKSVCFKKANGNTVSWCRTDLMLCDDASFAFNMSVSLCENQNPNGNGVTKTPEEQCRNLSNDASVNCTSVILSTCNGQNKCSLANITISFTNKDGNLTLKFFCNDTDSTITSSRSTTASSSWDDTRETKTENTTHSTANNKAAASQFSSDSTITSSRSTTASSSWDNTPETKTENTTHSTANNKTAASQFSSAIGNQYTAVIVVSVVFPITIAVVVGSIMLHRRGQCKVLLGKCIKGYAKHSPVRTDAYAMCSAANANLTYDLSSDVDVNSYDVDYCEIDKVGKKTDVEYSQVLKKSQVAKDHTYNHIEHFNSSPGNTEQTYNHVGDTTLKNTSLFTLQPDTYSHIGAMAKPASEQLAEDSYAHINGVKQYDINQYDCAVFESNGGPSEGFGHQEREMKSGK